MLKLLTFYELFTELCSIKGVSCRQACTDVGVAPSATARWKKQGATPYSTTLKKIEWYFGVVIDLEKMSFEDAPDNNMVDKAGETWLEQHATDDPKDEGLKKILSYLGGLSEDDMLKLRDIVDTLLK